MEKKTKKIILDFEKIENELAVLNINFYWERILVTGCQYVNK